MGSDGECSNGRCNNGGCSNSGCSSSGSNRGQEAAQNAAHNYLEQNRIYFQGARKGIGCRGCGCGTATMGFRERMANGVSVDWIGDQVIAAQTGGVFSSDSLQAYLTRLCVHSQCTQLVWFASDDLVSTPFSPML